MTRRGVRERLRAHAQRAAEAALGAVEPGRCVREALEARPLAGPCRILALGKAALAMVAGAQELLGDQLRGGLAVLPARAELPAAIGSVRVLPGAHPLPDESSAIAGRALLAEAAALAADETALVLLSGGASALAAVPIAGTTTKELAGLSSELLRSGAPIGEINRLRSSLSEVHAGGLSAAIGAGPARTLAISDVPGDLPGDIGSAPMHESDPAGAREFEVVASGRKAAGAAADWLRDEGYLVEIDADALAGAAEQAAVERLMRLRASGSGARALICWGEPSIRVGVPGTGGRCTHAALVAARALAAPNASPSELVFLACASDGRDGESGSAGALIDRGSLGRARANGRDPGEDLDRFDSALSLAAAGDLRPAEDSGTNVADIWVALRDDGDERLVPLEERAGLRVSGGGTKGNASLLLRGELRRRLLAAARRSGLPLSVARAWLATEPALAGGWAVELAEPSPALAVALSERGLDQDPNGTLRWRLSVPEAPDASPAWT